LSGKLDGIICFRYNSNALNTSTAPSLSNKYAPLLVLQSLNCIKDCINIRKNIDDGYSGTSFDRPEFKRMIADIESKKINMVITKDLSRFGRDYIQTGYYLEKYFPEKRVRYISLLDGIDTGIDSTVNDITPFKAIINDMYAKDISKKITSVKRDKQKKGLFIGWKAAYGYKISETRKNHIEIDEEAACVVRRMFEMALNDMSTRKIAETLTSEGILTPARYSNLPYRGAKKTTFSDYWRSEVVSKMLQNEVYIGNMVQGRKRKINYKSNKEIAMPKDQWIIVENTHEPITDKDTFYKVQTLINKRNRTRSRIHDYLLRGMVVCHDCGAKMGIIPRKLRDGSYKYFIRCLTYTRYSKLKKCTLHGMDLDYLTELVLDDIRGICKKYLNKKALSQIAKEEVEKAKQEKSLDAELESLQEKINKITIIIDKIYTDKLNGLLKEDDFARIYATKLKEREDQKQKLAYIKNCLGQKKKNGNRDFIKKAVEEFLNVEKPTKELLTTLVDKIEITEEKAIIIFYKFKGLADIKDY